MSVFSAVLRGVTRALASPRMLLWLWLFNLLAALPAAVLVGEAIRGSIGPSRVEAELRSSFDMGWYGEFQDGADGLEATFTPTHVGPGAFFANLEAWLSGDLFRDHRGLVAMGVVYALGWVLLLGGALEQLVRPAPVLSLDRFLTAAGRYFARFVRLTLLSAGLYYGVYRLANALFPWIERLTRDVTRETSVLAAYLAGAAVILFLLVGIKVVFDYAKIAIVADGRRSAVLAALRGLRFVVGHPLRTFGLAAVFGVLTLLALAAWSAVAPGALQSDWLGLAGALLAAQAYLVAKLALRLALVGAEATLYASSSRRTLPPPL